MYISSSSSSFRLMSFHDCWLHGWVSVVQYLRSWVALSRLVPDILVHVTTLSSQHILGLPRALMPSTRPTIKLLSMESCVFLITWPKYLNLRDFMWFSSSLFDPAIL